MTRECHVRFCERPGVKLPRPTHHGTGLWVHAKRLERGTFQWPKPTAAKDGKLNLDPAALAMLTDGIDLRDGMRRAWFERE